MAMRIEDLLPINEQKSPMASYVILCDSKIFLQRIISLVSEIEMSFRFVSLA
jgi:hypothetical protein